MLGNVNHLNTSYFKYHSDPNEKLKAYQTELWTNILKHASQITASTSTNQPTSLYQQTTTLIRRCYAKDKQENHEGKRPNFNHFVLSNYLEKVFDLFMTYHPTSTSNIEQNTPCLKGMKRNRTSSTWMPAFPCQTCSVKTAAEYTDYAIVHSRVAWEIMLQTTLMPDVDVSPQQPTKPPIELKHDEEKLCVRLFSHGRNVLLVRKSCWQKQTVRRVLFCEWTKMIDNVVGCYHFVESG